MLPENVLLATHLTQTAQNCIVEFRMRAKPSVTSFLGALVRSKYVITAYSVAIKMKNKETTYFARVNAANRDVDIAFVGYLTNRKKIAQIRVRSFK